jgi:iduronate 2-sulfatase
MKLIGRLMMKYSCVFFFFLSFIVAEKPNILLICIDDLRPELKCFGVDYIHSPNIDALAAKGRTFSRHYVQSPTCGASRYSLLTGHYGPGSNSALFSRAKAMQTQNNIPESMPAYFKNNGYTTVSVGKVSHHPGGRGGQNWDDDSEIEMPNSWDLHMNPSDLWQHPKGWMHGLANGEIRKNAKDMAVLQAVKGPDEIYPDGPVRNEALKQLDRLSSQSSPFFLAVGFVRPHLPFGAPAKYMEYYKDKTLPDVPYKDIPVWKSTFHKSGEFMKYNRWGKNPNEDPEFAMEVRKHYAACVSYADAQVGYLIQKLKEKELDKNTIVVLWGDHGWHLGERGIWGKHCLFEEALRSPLIISYPDIKKPSEDSPAIVETVDVFPTLCDLASLEKPSHLHGDSLLPQLENPRARADIAVAYRNSTLTSIRNERYRLVNHPKGEVELYDFKAKHPGRDNLAKDHPEIVTELKKQLEKRLKKFPMDTFSAKNK